MSEETLFHEALKRTQPSERAAFLDQACLDDPSLRRKVEQLLAAHAAPAGPLDATGAFAPGGAAPPATAPFAGAQPGLLVGGRYELLERLGEGGMGEVWVAKQSEPVKRRVALKLIKPGMDSKAVLARFEAERQALALMDHPNIARVLDGGVDGEPGASATGGRPYFVMELVNGLPLTKFCDEATLTPRQRLELFVPICQAVQHAHHKGIVHRDLKPSNILVTLIDGKPVPKVIDFGVAKATGGKLTDETLSTGFGAVVGTLEYMSPEQAGFSGQDIDTRADIYSLGVILYELLTGLRPIDGKRLRQAALTEMIRIIQEEEPSKPSTRLSTDAALPSLAAVRQTEPKKLMALLRGELDWVVMKCLEKDRNRRYETANGLARDIERYLADEAVEARPASFGYRASKFLRRNKGPVVAAGLVAAALLGGIIGTTWGMLRADEARAAEAKERNAALAARNAAFDALLAMTSPEALATMTKQPELTKEQKQFLEGAIQSFNALVKAEMAASDREGRCRLAKAQLQLGSCLSHLHRYQLAEAALRQALQLGEQLVAEAPDDAELDRLRLNAEQAVASALNSLGKLAEAEERWRALVQRCEQRVAAAPNDSLSCVFLVSCRSALATVQWRRDQRAEAEQTFRLAVQECREFLKRRPQERLLKSNFASLLTNFGSFLLKELKLKEAEAFLLEALKIEEELAGQDPDANNQFGIAAAQNALAAVYQMDRRFAEAEAMSRAALQAWQRMAAADPGTPWKRSVLANSWGSLARLFDVAGKAADAEAAFKEALKLQERLAADHPGVEEHRMTLARTHGELAAFYDRRQRWKEAEAAHREAVRLSAALAADFADQAKYRVRLALHHGGFGEHLRQTGRLSEAESEFRAALRHFDGSPGTLPLQADERAELAGVQMGLASVLASRDQFAESAALQRRLQQNLSELVAEFPARVIYRWRLATSHFNVGNLGMRTGKLAEAEADYRRAVQLMEHVVELVAKEPQAPSYKGMLANARLSLSAVLNGPHQKAEAEPVLRAAIKEFEELVAQAPHNLETQTSLAGGYCNMGAAVRDTQGPEASLPWYGKAEAVLKAVIEKAPKQTNAEEFLGNVCFNRALSLEQLRRFDEADQDWVRALPLSSGPKHEARQKARDHWRQQREKAR